MNWLALALPLVAQFEGCARIERQGAFTLVHAYLDTLANPPVWTIGYGRTYGVTKSTPCMPFSQAQDELKNGLKRYAIEVLKLAPALANNPACLAAVVSWAWNCGVGAFKCSRLRRAINEGRWAAAAQLIRLPNTAGGVVYRGLVRRRDAEALLFAQGLRP